LKASPKRPIPRGFITPLAHIRHVWLLCASPILFVWVATGQEQDRDLDTWIKNPAYTQVHPGISPDLFPIWPHIGKESRRYHLADTVSDLKRCQVCRKPLKSIKAQGRSRIPQAACYKAPPNYRAQSSKTLEQRLVGPRCTRSPSSASFLWWFLRNDPLRTKKRSRNKSADMPT